MHQKLHLSRRSLLRVSGGAAIAAAALPAAARAAAEGGLESRDLMRDKRPILHANGSKFGSYDPYGDFSSEKNVATEHLFLPWEDVELASLPAADDYARARGRNVLITIEPWSWSLDWNVGTHELRNLILSGRRDANMRAILSAVSDYKSPLVIRWAQEMDNPSGRFTWANWDPADYIRAYRRMTRIVREMLPHARIMWSPKGEKTLRGYYPGDKYVDLVGLSVFGLERFDVLQYGKPRTFAESLKQGYDLTAGYGKPIWVAELGYDGSENYLASWVQDVTAKYPQFPLLEEVVYFNDKEVWPWPHGLGLPNWRVVSDRPDYPFRRR